MTIDLNLLHYNALDCACTLQAHDAFWHEIDQYGYRWAYDFTMSLFEPLIFMQSRGLKVNFENLEKTKIDITAAIDRAQEELNTLCGRELNANSPKQVANYLYIEKGIPAYYNKNGGVTTDDKALQRIARGTAKRAGLREARLIQDIRGYVKLYGTYLDIDFDTDGRLRCVYNPRGTKFGRLSSSATVFGTGTNLQNLPQEFKAFIVPDDGYFFWEADKRQAEWVVVAYLSGDANMLSVIESGGDPHSHTAHLMFGIPEDIIKLDHKIVGGLMDRDEIFERRQATPELAGLYLPGSMSARQMGKKCLVEDTEVLTPAGWIPIQTLNTNTKILQFNSDMLEFVYPTAVNVYSNNSTESMISIESNHIHQIITPEHKLLIQRAKDRGGKRFITTAKNLDVTSTHWEFPISGYLDNKESLLNTWEMRLLVAIQADGSIDPYDNLILRVDKQRKLDRAELILSMLNLKFTKTNRGFFIHKSNPLCVKISNLLNGKHKLFGSYLLQCSQQSLCAFITEVVHWDGYSPKKQYFTTVKENAYWVQTIAHITGGRATVKERPPTGYGKKNLFWVIISTTDNTSLVSINKQEVEYTGNVYCPTVPSGFFIVRYKGKVSITGNSNHGLNYDEGYNTFALTNEIEIAEAKRIISLYHKIYPGIRQWHEFVRRQLSTDRSLTNCFGRKIRFLDAWGDTLFKSAYSSIPQSTVGDVTNMGMRDIYNSDLTDLTGVANIDIMAQVHDSVLMQVPITVLDDDRFFTIVDRVYNYISPELEYNQRKFKIATDSKFGLNWSGYHKEHNPLGMREVEFKGTPAEFTSAIRRVVGYKAPL